MLLLVHQAAFLLGSIVAPPASIPSRHTPVNATWDADTARVSQRASYVRMDFIVFSHLRWDFVYQRPQHLLSRCAREHRVFFWEEPVYEPGIEPTVNISPREDGLVIAVPMLPNGIPESANSDAQRALLASFLLDHDIEEYIAWYYTPMAMNFTDEIAPSAVVYDCMDELSAFRGAPPGLTQAEAALFTAADLVFTGGQSLYESKRRRHPSVHLFPSSIDVDHFSKARTIKTDPAEQASIAYPRLGYCGVIDERLDLELLAGMADLRPEWQIVMIGPVVKISESDLPRRGNIHYLGPKAYAELPSYLAGWDVALLPFARNESTRFISPTKTPEYLAAGCPAISTPITDVVRPYGELGLVSIGETADDFVRLAESWLAARSPEDEQARLRSVDAFLARSSWNRTWTAMKQLIIQAVRKNDDLAHTQYGTQVESTTATAD